MTLTLNAQTLGVTALIAGNAASFLAITTPSTFDIRRTPATTDRNRDVWQGVAIGAGLSLATAIGGTLVTGSPWPVIATVAVLAVFGGAYARALSQSCEV